MLTTLEADRARIAALDARISELERSPLSLRNERQTVQARLDAHIYPVLTLPDEIVSEIFVGTLPEYPLSPLVYGLLSPTSLSQICHKWREIALFTPMLWRAISFTVPSEFSPQFSLVTRLFLAHIFRLLDVLETWLSRSGSSPLSIGLDDPTLAASLSPFLRVLLPHFARVEHLQLSYKEDPAEDPVDSTMIALPLLRSLDLGSYHHTPITVFAQAPQLRTAILRNAGACETVLPRGQLTTLVLEYISNDVCAAILDQAASLVFCKIVVVNKSVHPDTPIPIIPLPHLTALGLTSFYPSMSHDAVTPLLTALTLPALHSLKIQEDHKAGFIDVIAAFLSRSGCILETLHIVQTEDWRQLTTPQHVYLAAFPFIPRLLVTAEEQKRG
ncbi:hypothetical protein C8R44DRAFT_741358 [Mycena epipterygia]|nr:hypothetical protein C8R44DRAFT_741358 [Mycena epipterygia]